MVRPRPCSGSRLARVALPLAAVLASSVPASAEAGDGAEALLGTYRLHGRAWLDARPFPPQDDEVHADVTLLPGAAPGAVRVRLAVVGARCELDATLDRAGVFTIAPGQRCPVDLSGETTQGQAEARVVTGRGRVRDDVLDLELTAALSGTVQLRSAGRLGSLGKVLSLPGSRERPVAFEGEARGRAAGRRDRSRAAQ
ncbi:MAG TPA: hypothetical protein VEB43_02025 [Anaeromyxobacter sp.]|nr:hypothetical protein [Anaeromyxobacter sp.]